MTLTARLVDLRGRRLAVGGLGLFGLSALWVNLLLAPDRPVVAQARAAGWTELATDRHRVLLVAPGS